jgi:hypothetical protein
MAFMTLAAAGCGGQDAGSAGTEGSGGSAQGSTGSSPASSGSASGTAVASASSGAGGGMPFTCDPPAAPGSIYERSAMSYDINEIDPVSMCKYRGDVMLIVNTAAV